MKSLWALGAGITFAFLAACVKLLAQKGVPTGQIVLVRSLIPTLVLLVFMRWRGLPVRTPLLRLQLTGSLSGVISLAAYFYAIKVLPLGTAVTLNYLSPVFVALFLILGKKQSVTGGSVLSLLVGFVGVALLLQPSFSGDEWLGYFLAIASAALGAQYFLKIRQLGSLGESSLRTVFYFSLFSSVASLPWALLHPIETAVEPKSATLLLVVGALALSGQIMITLAYQGGRPLVTAALGYSQIIFSVLLGILVWHDEIPLYVGLGVFMIIVSGILIFAARER